MKSAQEMYQYCLDHNYGEGMNKKWGEKHFSLIAQALGEDEDVIMCFIGLHNYTSPTKHDNNFASIFAGRTLYLQMSL